MIFGSYIAGAGTGDTEKRKLQSVRHFFNNPGKTQCQLIMGQSIVICSVCDVTCPHFKLTRVLFLLAGKLYNIM